MQILRKITHTLLAVLILLSTTGVTMHQHHCLGRLQSVSYNEHAPNCLGEQNTRESSCPMDCCEDTHQEFRVDNLNNVSFNFDLHPVLYLAGMDNEVSLLLVKKVLIGRKTSYAHYKPPIPDRDVQTMIQTFLI